MKMINGITDGIMIAVLVLIGVLVIIVAFLCIRFTLLAKIEEDYKEIGVLKAVGMRVSQIKKLYLAKYGAIAGRPARWAFWPPCRSKRLSCKTSACTWAKAAARYPACSADFWGRR